MRSANAHDAAHAPKEEGPGVKLGPIKLSWPTALVLVVAIVAVAAVLILAPAHSLEALSGLGGLVVGAALDRLATRAPRRRRKPTIDELEAILNGPSVGVEILPNGEVRDV